MIKPSYPTLIKEPENMAKDNCSTCFEIAFFWYSMKSPLYKLTQTVGEMFIALDALSICQSKITISCHVGC